MNIRKTITSEIEWNTIKKAQADGKLQELLQVGDELDITLKTGEELTVQAVGTTERCACGSTKPLSICCRMSCGR